MFLLRICTVTGLFFSCQSAWTEYIPAALYRVFDYDVDIFRDKDDNLRENPTLLTIVALRKKVPRIKEDFKILRDNVRFEDNNVTIEENVPIISVKDNLDIGNESLDDIGRDENNFEKISNDSLTVLRKKSKKKKKLKKACKRACKSAAKSVCKDFYCSKKKKKKIAKKCLKKCKDDDDD